MTQSTVPMTRFWILAAAIIAAMLILVGRLWQLQLFDPAHYAEQSARIRLKAVWEPAPRGLIYDRNGVVLADNRPMWNVAIRPADFPSDEGEAEKVIQQLAGLLPSKPTTAQVRAAIAHIIKSHSNVDSVCLDKIGEDVPLTTVARIEEHSYELPGVEIQEVSQRYYPHKDLACHVLGYARIIDADELEKLKKIPVPQVLVRPVSTDWNVLPEYLYSPTAIIGKSGIEKVCELDESTDPPLPMLQGIRGRTLYEVTIKNEPIGPPLEEREPIPGASIYLTLDARLQQVAEQSLHHAIERAGPASIGAAVLLDVNSGEVLVLASVPGYDLNRWVRGWTRRELEQLQNDPRKPQNNYAIAGQFPPGSTFKIISAVTALCEVGLKTTTTFVCKGNIHEGEYHRRFDCWKKGGHGRMDFYQALAQSCDVYFYELARKAGVTGAMLAEYARKFGLGSPTGIELPAEAAGFVPTPEWKLNILREKWWRGNTLNMIIGQGYLTVTPLQMAVVTAAVANGGKLVHPTLLRKIQWPAYTKRGVQMCTPQPPRDLGIDPTALAHVRRGMRLACSDKHGTASWMFRKFPIAVAGKTGSAEHGRDKPPHAWFVAFAPYDKPKYACAVLVSEGGHGSTAAAPVARDILAAAFNLKRPAPEVSRVIGD